MQNQNVTKDPISGKIYRLTPAKQRTAAYAALEAAISAAKEVQASYMKANNLAFDATRRVSVEISTGEPPTGEVFTRIIELLTATRAAQFAAKAYKTAHPGEFQAQTQGARAGRIPTINVPTGRRRGRGRGAD